MCVAIGIFLLIGINSCDNKKDSSSSKSKSSKEKSEKSKKIENEDEDFSSASDATESNATKSNATESNATERANPKSEKLVLLDFYATWCGPCKMMTPIMEEMEKKYSENMEFKKIDIDKEPALAEKYRINAVPTFVILSPRGEEIDRMEGACDAEIMDETLWELINYHTVK
ncbi:MAG: thioredoxin [Muribaculaceae bacterium]|nr:thioredoxin [Muribaculaceae bacterium]